MDKEAIYKRQYYLRNKELCNRQSAEWRKANPERRKIICQRYIKRNKFRRKISVLMGDIKERCYNKKCRAYKWYGGKGVTNFLTVNDLIFLWRKFKADKLKRASIDRIDNGGHYTLDNCQFIEHVDNCKKQWTDKELVK